MAKKELKINKKAEKLNAYLEENKLNVFTVEGNEDEYHTAVFRSQIEAKGQRMPLVVIVDDTVFTIVRIWITTGVAAEKKEKLVMFLNEINEKYKAFKYYLREDGSVVLDVYLPFVEETFDAKMIHLMLQFLVDQLNTTYGDIMAHIWAQEEK